MPDVVEVITKLAANFTKLIELMLSKEIKASLKHSNVALWNHTAWNQLTIIIK